MSPALSREERVSTVSLRAIALSDPQDTAKTGALALMARLAADELDATQLALAVAETENERLRRVTHDIDQELGIFEHQRDAARAEVAALRGRIEALANGPDHHLILSDEPVRTEARMDGTQPYGLRYTGEVGAIAIVYQTPAQADRLRMGLAAQPHVNVERLRAALSADEGERTGR